MGVCEGVAIDPDLGPLLASEVLGTMDVHRGAHIHTLFSLLYDSDNEVRRRSAPQPSRCGLGHVQISKEFLTPSMGLMWPVSLYSWVFACPNVWLLY